jgi:hypothetical protein
MQSLAHQFLTFCRSKPADLEYTYEAPCGCAFYLFLSESGYPVRSVIPNFWSDHRGDYHRFPETIEKAVQVDPWSFGALADRLEAALARGTSK